MRRNKLTPRQARILQARYSDMAMRLEMDQVAFRLHVGFPPEVVVELTDAWNALKTASQLLATFDLGERL